MAQQESIQELLKRFREEQDLPQRKSIDTLLAESRAKPPIPEASRAGSLQQPKPIDFDPSDPVAFGAQLMEETFRHLGSLVIKSTGAVGRPVPGIGGQAADAATEAGDFLTRPEKTPIFNAVNESVTNVIRRIAGEAGVSAVSAVVNTAVEITPEVAGAIPSLAAGQAGIAALVQKGGSAFLASRAGTAIIQGARQGLPLRLSRHLPEAQTVGPYLAATIGEAGSFGIYEAAQSEDLSDVPRNFGYGALLGLSFGVGNATAWRMEQAVRKYYRNTKKVQTELFENEFRAASQAARPVGEPGAPGATSPLAQPGAKIAEGTGTAVEQGLHDATGISRREAIGKIGAIFTAAQQGVSAPIILGAAAVKFGELTLKKLADKAVITVSRKAQMVADENGEMINTFNMGNPEQTIKDGGTIESNGDITFDVGSIGGMNLVAEAIGGMAYQSGSGQGLRKMLEKVEKILPGAAVIFKNEAKLRQMLEAAHQPA